MVSEIELDTIAGIIGAPDYSNIRKKNTTAMTDTIETEDHLEPEF